MRANSFVREAEHSAALRKRLTAVENEFHRLQAIESRFRELEKENDELRTALAFQKRARFQVVAARVIRRKPSTWWETAVIDRGAERGIAAQAPVLSGQGLVGKTTEAADGTSTVVLLTDESCQVSAKVEGTPEVGIVSGQRAAYGKDPVLLFPLPLQGRPPPARHESLYHRARRPFPPGHSHRHHHLLRPRPLDAEATLRPAVDFNTLGTVFVITPEPSRSEENPES